MDNFLTLLARLTVAPSNDYDLANRMLGWWWVNPPASLVMVFYAVKEALHIFRPYAVAHA